MFCAKTFAKMLQNILAGSNRLEDKQWLHVK